VTTPPPELAPSTPEALAAALAEATRDGRRVLPRGLGSRVGPGARGTPADLVLSTRGLDGLVAHDAADLTVTVQAGMPLAALDDHLAAHAQWLPHQPWRRRGSVGGLLASGADGALALRHGRTRDDLVGVRVALADGTLARGRGRVVKNVAGFDLPRLLAGSLGTLGVIVEASFKLCPRPPASATLVAGYDDVDQALAAATRVLASPTRATFVDVAVGACSPQVAVGLDDRIERVDGERPRVSDRLSGEGHQHTLELDPASQLSLREGLDDPPATLGGEQGAAVVRWWGRPRHLPTAVGSALTLAPAARLHLRPGLGQVFVAPPADADLPTLLAALRSCGHAVVLAGARGLAHDPDLMWGPPPDDHGLMARVKRALDPAGTLVPGRFVGGL
jgi:glycolate oxidase FAD binding subunit